MAAEHGHSPLDHVVDHNSLEFPWIRTLEVPLPVVEIAGYQVQITKFMVMQLLAAVLVALIFIPLARHVARNPVTRGRFWNMFEAVLLFIRDGIARPAIGGHAADAYLPFLWTLFFFVLFCNLLGMVPGGATATGNINVTGVLAMITLLAVFIAGAREQGVIKYWTSIVPHMDVPFVLRIFLWPLMFVIEVAGLLIRHIVLAVRLFANMLAGHIVLAVIIGFIVQAAGLAAVAIVPASLAGGVALSLLELFVAFLQAYIFTFLAALFIGASVHPH